MQTGTAEMNVTPLIDVLLVLLIIFMVITPVTPKGLSAALPTDAPERSAVQEQPLLLRIGAHRELSIDDRAIAADALGATMERMYARRANQVLFLQADRSLLYREVAQVIDQVRGARPDIQVVFVSAAR